MPIDLEVSEKIPLGYLDNLACGSQAIWKSYHWDSWITWLVAAKRSGGLAGIAFFWSMAAKATKKPATAAMKASKATQAMKKVVKAVPKAKGTKAMKAMKVMKAAPKAMKAMKVVKTMKAAKKPATRKPAKDGNKKKDDDKMAKNMPGWLVDPFRYTDDDGVIRVEVSQLEVGDNGTDCICTEGMDVNQSIQAMISSMEFAGCSADEISYQAVGIAVCVKKIDKKKDDDIDDTGKDDDKKKVDDQGKDDDQKKDDDTSDMRSNPSSYSHGPYRLSGPHGDGLSDLEMDDGSPKDDDKKKDDDNHEPRTPPEWTPGHVYNSVTRRHEPLE